LVFLKLNSGIRLKKSRPGRGNCGKHDRYSFAEIGMRRPIFGPQECHMHMGNV
jgi:hypothetical protein